MNYKRKQKYSKGRCNICAGQRRRWGAGNMKMKSLLKVFKKEDVRVL